MKVGGVSNTGSANASRAPARAQGGFSLEPAASAAGPARTAPTQGMTGVASLDALLALQAVGTPGERKRRAVRRAGALLDMLDEIKVGILDDEIPASALDRLMAAIREQREETDDPRLEGVLDEIETRAAVEMAKLEVLQHAA